MSDSFRITAIMSAFNEGDIISSVIGHLVENGIDVYLIDNHSTDDTVEQAEQWLGRGLLQIETFPEQAISDSATPGSFDWTAILHRKEELARELPANWFIHHDADEIRESPWPNVSLKDAIRWIDGLDYNCISFKVLNFPPVDDGFKRGDDPRSYFTLCEDGADFDKVQLKCWKACKSPVSLVETGGHDARFEGRRVFPIPLLLRHYPIRGQSHGRRKVFAERKNRFLKSERTKGWHVQYDGFKDETQSFLRDATTLRPFDLERTRLELVLPEKILWHLSDRLMGNDHELTALRSRKEELEQYATNMEVELRQQKQKAANLLGERDQFNSRAETLEQERDELRKHAEGCASERDQLKTRARTLEEQRNELRGQLAKLENFQRDLEDRSRSVEQDLTDIRNSRSWRWTAWFRRIFDLFASSPER